MKTETINLYTLEEAEKIINYRRRKATRKKRKALKQKLIFKGFSLACIILAIAVALIVKADNGGCIAVALISLLGLIVPYNATITW